MSKRVSEIQRERRDENEREREKERESESNKQILNEIDNISSIQDTQ